ncbi:alpha-ketoglutarate-dependent dioxygenase alkB homolog 7, mitochondrial isoform X1 [Grus americana]|uniref:alpha-ketoglutarate-dependent dioxygenase alkB homolog 7, mitochondrial isoform X1 n=1 Tax=Grus americana TaxID=9117 RepID=UPI0024085D83|nr:alpha-ketoglutarate-dependent dioxygenase alkB homolog 7, mitochondrial isoform X1 [Grus americana]
MHRARGLWRLVAGPRPGAGAATGAGDGAGAGLGLGPEAEADPGLLHASSPAVERRLRGLALVRGGFLSPGEAAELLRELEPVLGRRPYQFDHWDGAICGYRETERAQWGGAGRAVLARLGGAFPPGRPAQPLVHVLDLHPRGHVGPHRDSVKFCGCTIAGVSLLTPSVMRLVSCRPGGGWLELLLEPGSLYVLRGAARYEFTHEILPDHASFFGGRRVPRGRRVALICRNAPQETTPDAPGDSPAFIGGTETEPPPPPKNSDPHTHPRCRLFFGGGQ